jgi:hypothetical protein
MCLRTSCRRYADQPCLDGPNRADDPANFLTKRWHFIRPDSVFEVSNKVSPALAQGARGVQTSAGDRADQVLDLLAKLTSTRCHIRALRFDLA